MKKILKRTLLILTILGTTALFSDSVIISDEKPTFQKKHTFNKYIKTTKSSKKYSKRKFKRDHHRYDKRYRSFDYDRNSYYDNEGYYYGYYDNTGYFFNNIFFEYNSRYSYNDRIYLRGYFRPTYQHRRVYVHHASNNWNRVHCYREPNVIVHGYYYDSPTYRNSYNNSHQTHYYERDRGRVSHGRFSDHDERRAYRQAENRRDDFRRDERYNNNNRQQYRDNYNRNRENYRDNGYRRDNARLNRGHFSDKKSRNQNRTRKESSSHKNSGHLRISK